MSSMAATQRRPMMARFLQKWFYSLSSRLVADMLVATSCLPKAWHKCVMTCVRFLCVPVRAVYARDGEILGDMVDVIRM